MRVIKKAVEVDAWKVPTLLVDVEVKDAPSENMRIPQWAILALQRGLWNFPKTTINGENELGFVETDRGRTDLAGGDWLIRGTEGEIYACSDEVFHKVYTCPPEPAGG